MADMNWWDKAWDCDLPENPYLRARYWTDKAVAAEADAARRSGAEAATWAAMAKSWRAAIEYLKYPPITLVRRPAHKTRH
jgi:hypothetical protein